MNCLQGFAKFNFTRFEMFMIFGIYGTFYIVRASSLLFPTFANVTPEWRCGFNGSYSQNCSLITLCNENVTYRSMFYSARQEFNLVCNRAYKGAIVSSVQFVGVVIGANVLGQVSDVYGRRWVAISIMCGEIIFGLSSSFARCYISLGAMRFLAGFFSGGAISVLTVYLVESIKPQQRVFMFTVISWPVTQAIITGIAYLTNSWRWFLRFCSLSGILTPVLVFAVAPESLKWAKDRGRHDLAVKIMHRINRINGTTWNKGSEDEIGRLRQTNNGHLSSGLGSQKPKKYAVKDLIATKQLTILTAVMCFLWSTVALTSYTIYFDSSNLSGNFYINQLLLAFFYFAANMTVLVVDTLVPRFNRRVLHQGPQLLAAVLSAIITVILMSGNNAGQMAVTYLAVVTTYFAAFVWDSVYLCTAELFPTEVRGTAFGVCNFVARCSLIIAPQTVLLRQVWEPGPYLIMALVGFVAFGLSHKFLPDTKNMELPGGVEDVTELTSRDKCEPKEHLESL